MKIDHLGIATKDLETALSFWQSTLGLELVDTEEVASQKVRVALLALGESRVELLEPTENDSTVARFLEKRGPGLHHLAVRVSDIRETLSLLKKAGARLIDEEPRVGAQGCLVAFIHPATAGGVLLELVQQQ